MLSNTGYGSSGPWAAFRAQGTTLEATMGLSHYAGYEDGPPVEGRTVLPGLPRLLDRACCTVLAALVERERSGEGQWIDLGMYQLGAAVIPEALLGAQLRRARSRRAARAPSPTRASAASSPPRARTAGSP